MNADTDNDTIPNQFDVDADGDMCSDALEAGHGETILTGDMIDGIFGANGFDDDLQTAGTDTTMDTFDDGSTNTPTETNAGTGDWLDSGVTIACV